MLNALLFLQYWSTRNRLALRLRRLKQPKYLLGGIVGGLYFYFYFFRYLFGAGRSRPAMNLVTSSQDLLLFESFGALILFTLLVLAWLIPHKRAALAFTEAEVAFLFPAPLSRRALVHYKLLRSQMGILFTTLILVFLGRRSGGNAWTHAAGWWLILSTLNLHLLGSSFARTMLLDRGISNWQRRLAVLGLVVAAAVLVITWAARSLPDFDRSQLQNTAELKNYARQVLTAGPMPYVLYPWRLVVRPYLALNGYGFLLALGPALFLLALHYVWVIRSNVAFEEASVEASRKLADKVAAVRAGKWQMANDTLKRRRAPFALQPVGRPAVALFWKNLISAGQVFRLRVWLMLVIVGVTLCFSVGQSAPGSDFLTVFGLVAAGFVVWSLFLGPQFLRQDFRQDFGLADVLKMYPLRGWQVALGELLAPAAILTGIQWFLLLVSLALVWHADFPQVSRTARLASCFGAAVVLPMLNLITLQIPNAAVLLFPAWFQPSKDGLQGIEATGQRIISVIAQLLVFALAMLPASVGFVVVFVLAKMLLGMSLALAMASVAAAVVLAGEAAAGLALLGRLFEALDVSTEAPS